MSQALRDLPDPTQPAPVLPTANADDLLAKMADEAIDKLLAEADNGPPKPALKLRQPPLPPVEQTAIESSITEAALNDLLTSAAEPAPPAAVTEAPDQPSTIEPPPAETAVVPPAPHAAESAVDAPVAASAGEANVTVAAVAPPPKDDVKALLAEETQTRPSPLLWPLWLLNAPFAWMSDRARQALGLIGIVTLVPAVCAIVYVIYLKKH